MQARVIRSDGGLWLGGLRWEEKGRLEEELRMFTRFRVFCQPGSYMSSIFVPTASSLDFNEQRDYEECARISGLVNGGTIDCSEGWAPGEQVHFEGASGIDRSSWMEVENQPVRGLYSPRVTSYAIEPGITQSFIFSDLPPLNLESFTVVFPPQPEQPKEEPTSKPPTEPRFKPTRGGPISRARFLLMKRRGSW